jgi:hypothetical protein
MSKSTLAPGRALSLLTALLVLTACGPGDTPEQAPAQGTAPAEAFEDPELSALRQVVAPDACQVFAAETLARVFPGVAFEVRERLEPRMSGYLWDSRCTYWAVVGSQPVAADAPTHTLDVFIRTSANETKAAERLAEQHRGATTSRDYRALPELGADAHTTADTGVASVFYRRGASEFQLRYSDLGTPSEQKVQRLVELAQQPG